MLTSITTPTHNPYDPIARAALQAFPHLRKATIQLVMQSENITFRVIDCTTNQSYILRINRPGYHSKKEIESEIQWIRLLQQEMPFEIAMPIPDVEGHFIQETLYEGIGYYSTLFTYLEGVTPDEQHEQTFPQHFYQLGMMTAKLHNHVERHHERYETFDRITWDFETLIGPAAKWGKWQEGRGMTAERERLFQRAVQTMSHRMRAFGQEPSRFGLIHSDLRFANLLVENERIQVIDFDDCGFGWYLYDLAAALSFIEHQPYVPQLIESWLRGYRQLRTLSEEEENEIPTFILMRRLQLIAWIGSRDNDTTRAMGEAYTQQTDALVIHYLQQYE